MVNQTRGGLTPAPQVRGSRVFEEISNQIRSLLNQGNLSPGDKLPAERELALQLGASRTAVREALRGLEMAGIVELRKGVKGGAFIRPGDPAVVTRSFSDMVSLGRISLTSLTESRVLILESVVRLACERGTSDDFDTLEESINQTEKLTREGRMDERRQQLVKFYGLLAQATGNEVMSMMVDALTGIVLQVMAELNTPPRQDTVKAHREILRALRDRDAALATKKMTTHLNALHHHLLQAESRSGPSRTRRS